MNEFLTLRNNLAEVQVSTLAAEVRSFKLNSNNIERIWCRDKNKGWRNCNPILFPIVGKLIDNQFTVDGNSYSMGQHGFSRDSEFTVEKADENEIILSLSANSETLKVFPYNFKISVRYHLEGQRLVLSYRIENPGTVDLPFMVGFHPAFAVPCDGKEKFDDYRIVFPQNENLTNESVQFGNCDGFPLTIFDIDKPWSFFFRNHQINSEYVDLVSDNYDLRVGFKGFSTIGFWHGAPKTEFLCIEPWFPENSLPTDHTFRPDKENWLLAPGKEFNFEYYWEIIK